MVKNKETVALTTFIKREAQALGFASCGIARAEELVEERPRLQHWLDAQMHGQMHYMANHVEKRLDPRKLVEGTRSVVVVTLSYLTREKQADSEAPILSKYAYGTDYHKIVKNKLHLLLGQIKNYCPEAEGRAFVDSAPVLEHAWATRAGLGWIGKHSLLLSKESGSFTFIGELLLNQELVYDEATTTDLCGKCTRCIDACPTQAIVQERVVDGSKCISYHTIEYKGELNTASDFQNRVFGCDICQDVCPYNHNQKLPSHRIPEFHPSKELLNLTKEEWHNLSESQFRNLFKHSPVKRTKFCGLKRNLNFLKKNSCS